MPTVILDKPRLRQCFTVEVLPPRTVFLLSEHRHLVFEGEIYVALVPLLDGQHTFDALLAAIGPRFAFTEVYGALQRLGRQHCLVETDAAALPEHTAFWDHLGLVTPVRQSPSALHTTTVTVRPVGALDDAGLTAALTRAGVRVGDDGDLFVVVTDDYLRPELEAINHSALEQGRPWVLLKPDGLVVWVGPLFRPGATGCWECLAQRLRANRQVERYIENRTAQPVRFQTSRARLAATRGVGVYVAATEIAKSLLVDAKAGLDGKLFTLDLLSCKLDEHTLVRRPQCPACGQPRPMAAPPPVTLTSHQKLRGAGTRTATPEEVFQRYQHHISPITGVVTSFVPLGLDSAGMMYNYLAGHYFPLFTNDATRLRVNQIARSGGKGTTEMQAKASALAEAIERYSGIRWGDEPTVRASYAALRPEAVHAHELLLFSDNQYRNHREWNAHLLDERHAVPDPFDEQAEIAWTPVWSLTHNRQRYLPTAFCYYGHIDAGHPFCRCDSNGCAAGSTLEEAIVQGFLELVERDAVALWWYNRLQRPAVDVDSFGLPYWHTIRAYYEHELHRDLHVLDVTTDLQIAAFVVVSRRRDQEVEDIIIGFGANLDPRAALMQALAEANQSVPTLRLAASDRSVILRHFSRSVLDWLQHATYANQPYLVPAPHLAPKTLADYQQLASNDVKEDVLTCVRLARERGLEVLVLDQTRPDIGMPVARVVVPGLRHFWRRLGPGRLYDVPVQLGWLARPLTEAELNPISCFI